DVEPDERPRANRRALRSARIPRDRRAAASHHPGPHGPRVAAVAQDQDEWPARHRGAGHRALHRALDAQGPERTAGDPHPLRLLFPSVMIIRALLLTGLAAIGWLVFLRRNKLPFHIVIMFVMLGVGAAAVLAPEQTLDDIAR